MSAEITIRPATGSISMSDAAIDTSDDAEFLASVLGQWHANLVLYLKDREWPLHDEPGRRNVMGALAQMGFILARLTQLIEAPPEDATERALNFRSIREATQDLANWGYPVRPSTVEFLRERGVVIHFPTSRPAAESCPPPSPAPQGAERGTA